MYDSLSTYLNSVQRAWSAQDGNLVAAFVSLKDKHVSSRSLQIEMPENMVERMMDPPMDEIVSAHLRVLYYLTCERKNINFCSRMKIEFCFDFQPKITWQRTKIRRCVPRQLLKF